MRLPDLDHPRGRKSELDNYNDINVGNTTGVDYLYDKYNYSKTPQHNFSSTGTPMGPNFPKPREKKF